MDRLKNGRLKAQETSEEIQAEGKHMTTEQMVTRTSPTPKGGAGHPGRALRGGLAILLILGGLQVMRVVSVGKQSLDVGSAAAAEGSLAALHQIGGTGSSMLVHDGAIYTGLGPRVLRFDRSGIGDELVATSRSAILSGNVIDLEMVGELLYAMVDPAGLVVLEDRGTELAEVGSLWMRRPAAMTSMGSNLLVADRGELGKRTGGIDVIDLAEPRRPGHLARFFLPTPDLPSNRVFGVRLVEGEGRTHALYLDEYSNHQYAVIELGADGVPGLRSSGDTERLNVYDARAVGDRLAVIDQYALVFFDISERGDLRLIQRLSPAPDFYASRMAFDGSRLVLSSAGDDVGTRSGLFTFDARDPEKSLQETGWLGISPAPYSMHLEADRLTTLGLPAAGSAAVATYRLPDAGPPTLSSSLDRPGYLHQVVIDDNLALARGQNDVWAFSMDGGELETIGRIERSEVGNLVDMAIDGDLLYTVSHVGGLRVSRINGAEPASQVGALERDRDDLYSGAFDLSDDLMALLAYRNKIRDKQDRAELRLIDLAEPTAPTIVATQTLPSDSVEVILTAKRAVVLGSAVTVLDLSDPIDPKLLGSAPMVGAPIGLVAPNEDQVVAASDERLVVLSIGGPNGPIVRSVMEIEGEILAIGAGTGAEAPILALQYEPVRGQAIVQYSLTPEGLLVEEARYAEISPFFDGTSIRPQSLVFQDGRILIPGLRSGLFVMEPYRSWPPEALFFPALRRHDG